MNPIPPNPILRPWSSHGDSPRALEKLLDGDIGWVVVGFGKILQHLRSVVHVNARCLLGVSACAHLHSLRNCKKSELCFFGWCCDGKSYFGKKRKEPILCQNHFYHKFLVETSRATLSPIVSFFLFGVWLVPVQKNIALDHQPQEAENVYKTSIRSIMMLPVAELLLKLCTNDRTETLWLFFSCGAWWGLGCSLWIKEYLSGCDRCSFLFPLTIDNLCNSNCVSPISSSPHGASVKMAQVHADPAVRLHLDIIAITYRDNIWNVLIT